MLNSFQRPISNCRFFGWAWVGSLADESFFEAHAALEKLAPLAREIGWILCKEKNRRIVEYALHDARKPIGGATYEITKTLPKALRGQLPQPEEIAAMLEGMED